VGYTPLFDTMLTGTLYGRWPHTGIWACLLSRATREGIIDETPQALAAAIGVPVDTLMTCIRDFMNPDPDSRSPEHDGRRLALIHEHRSWGWKVVNHVKYRDKARKRSYDEDRTASGRDAERKRSERAQGDVPTSPDESRRVPPSEAKTEAEANKKRASALVLHPSLPEDSWAEWLEFRKGKRFPSDDLTLRKQLALLAKHPTQVQREIIDTSINAGWQGLFALKDQPKNGRASVVPDDRDWADLMHRGEKVGAPPPMQGQSVQAYQTIVARAEDESRRRRSAGGPVAVGSVGRA
jgi:hypothetical protein